MNRYILSSAFRNFKNNKKMYSFFVIEIFLAGLIMNIFMGIGYSSMKKLHDTKKELQNESIKIVMNSATRKDDHYFTEENYKYIKQKYGDKLKISYSVLERPSWFINSKRKVAEINTLFVNDEFFQIFFGNEHMEGFELSKNVYVGKNVKGEFMESEGHRATFSKDDNYSKFFHELSMENEQFILNGNKFNIKPLEEVMGDRTEKIIEHSMIASIYDVREHDMVDLDNTIIIPMKYSKGIEEFVSEVGYQINSVILLKFNNNKKDDDTLFKIYNYLKKNHEGRYEYDFTSKFGELQRMVEKQKRIIKTINIILVFCLVIITIGINGLMVMNINRRKKNIAVAVTMGAKNSQIMMGIIYEVMMITIPPALIANILSGIAVKNFIKMSEYKLVIPIYSYIIVFALSIVVGIVSCVIPINRLKKLMPLEVLRETN